MESDIVRYSFYILYMWLSKLLQVAEGATVNWEILMQWIFANVCIMVEVLFLFVYKWQAMQILKCKSNVLAGQAVNFCRMLSL